jgi:hypothetical protein
MLLGTGLESIFVEFHLRAHSYTVLLLFLFVCLGRFWKLQDEGFNLQVADHQVKAQASVLYAANPQNGCSEIRFLS